MNLLVQNHNHYCGDESLVQNHNHYTTARAIIIIPWGRIEKSKACFADDGGLRNLRHALLMKANKPETALYRAPTFSLLLASQVDY